MKTERIVNVAQLEQETGLAKDRLRKWRSRYGFPVPVYSKAHGGWAYADRQIAELRLIRRLLDAGFRPQQIVGVPLEKLERLLADLPCGDPVAQPRPAVAEAIKLLQGNAITELDRLFERERSDCSATEFVISFVAPLAIAVGDAWSRGALAVYQEHLCTSALMARLTCELAALRSKQAYPRVILATLSDETHALGLMMARVVLADSGADCLYLGAQVPTLELAQAASACSADIVALSFSFAFPGRKVRPELMRLRQALPDAVEVWAGGKGVENVRRPPAGVRLFADLASAAEALHERARVAA